MATSGQQRVEQAASGGPDKGAPYGVQPGWTVFDSLDRPIGSVADAEGGVLRIDGRPQGHGFFPVPVGSIERTGDNHVYLNKRLEELFSFSTEAGAGPTGGSGGTSTLESPPTPAPTSPAAERYPYPAASPAPGSSGASGPVGQIYTPTRGLETTDESSWSKAGAFLGTAGLVAAAGSGLVWWRRHQARKSRMQRIRQAMLGSAALAAPLSRTAFERGDARLLTPLAALPLLLLLGRAARRPRVEPSAVEVALAPVRRLDWSERLAQLRSELPVSMPANAPAAPPKALRLGALALGVGAMAFSLARRKRHQYRSGASSSGRLGDIMTRHVEVIRPDQTIFEATGVMKRLNVGFLPVCDGRRLQGVLTDRDIVVRPIADSRDPHQATVRDAMSTEVVYAFEDDRVERGAELMKDHQIRRLPIVDRAKNLVGVVSLGDLAVDTGDQRLSGATVERISEPSQPRR
jgi:CBS domain-containing protein